MTNRLFLIEAQVSFGKPSSWPGEIVGGLLTIFALASSSEVALQLALRKITALELKLISLQSGVEELATEGLDGFVSERWPGFAHLCPTAVTIQASLDQDQVFLGPMFGYSA